MKVFKNEEEMLMWTRIDLKDRAKACLRKYYWAAFVVSLIASLASGFSSGNGGSTGYNSGNSGTGNNSAYVFDLPAGNLTGNLPDSLGAYSGILENVPVGGSTLHMGRLFWGFLAGAVVILVILALVISIFVAPAIEVGRNRFYMESRLIGQSAGVGKILWGFTHNYLNIIWTMFLRGLFIGLGTILCVFPGIYLSYCYYMVPYILAENPDMKPMEAMRLSKSMMEGHKFNTFVLELSFFGWLLLGACLCFVGTFFVLPYYDATFAELYAVLRQPFSGNLNGFGYPDVVPTGSYNGTWQDGYQSGYQGGSGYGQGSGYGTGGNYGQGTGYDAGGSYSQGYGYDAGGSYGQGYGDGTANQPFGQNGGAEQNYGAGQEASGKEDRGSEVNRSEGGPGRGYYLNGVFYPYTDEDNQ